MKVKKTARNFEIIEFKDIYDCDCSLQQSSLAKYQKPGSSAVWLGCMKNAVHPGTGEQMSPRMHLDRKLVRQLVTRLQHWLKNGSFK